MQVLFDNKNIQKVFGTIAVACQYCFVTNNESFGFHGFYIFVDHIETNQLIRSNNYMTGFSMDRISTESVRLYKYIGKIRLIEIAFLIFLQ